MTEYYSHFAIDQIKAAAPTLEVVQHIKDISLAAVKETDIYRLRRGLCLPSATATNINTLLGTRLIGETYEDAPLRIADLYDMVLPYHNRTELEDKEGNINNRPWFVATPQGDMYHHTMIALAEGLGLHANSIENFKSLEDLLPFLEKNGALALSLDNRFVIDVTLQNDPELTRKEPNGDDSILIENGQELDFRKFENGRHVVSLLGLVGDNIIVHDSFRLPQMKHSSVMEVPIETVNHYLRYYDNASTRGIAFATDTDSLQTIEHFENKNIFIPQELVYSIQEKTQRKLQEIV